MSGRKRGETLGPRARITQVFKDTKCGDLVKDQTPISIPADTSVQDACDVLVKNRIHFAPVHSSDDKNKFIGVFTFRSLSAFILDQFANNRVNAPRKKSSPLSNQGFDLRRMIVARVGSQRTAAEYSLVNEFLHCKHDRSLLSTGPMFRRGWHRVCILDSNGSFMGVLTQAMVMRAFIEKVDNLDALFPEPISKLFPQNCNKTLFTISDKELMMTAFSTLHEKRVSALAVTSDNGQIVSSIALRDIKEIFRTGQHRMLFSSVHDFTLYKSSQHTNALGLLAVQSQCTIALAIQKMMSTRIHRVWIVDNENKPIGVLSLSDVITYLLS